MAWTIGDENLDHQPATPALLQRRLDACDGRRQFFVDVEEINTGACITCFGGPNWWVLETFDVECVPGGSGIVRARLDAPEVAVDLRVERDGLLTVLQADLLNRESLVAIVESIVTENRLPSWAGFFPRSVLDDYDIRPRVTPANFWVANERPGVTDEALDFVERGLSRRLPEDLKALYRIQNGGASRYEIVDSPFGPCPLPPLLGVTSGPGVDTLLQGVDRFPLATLEMRHLVFSCDGVGWLALDYSDPGQHKAPPWVLQCPVHPGPVEIIADSFGAFLASLELVAG